MDSAAPDLSSLRIDRGESPDRSKAAPRRRRRRRRWIGPLVFLALLAGVGYLVWPRVQPWIARLRSPEVKTGVVVRTRPGSSLELTTASGYVVPRVKAALAAEVSGQLVRLDVDVGDLIERGELVAQIDPRDWEHERDRRRAVLASAVSAREVSRVRTSLASNVLERLAAQVVESTAAIAETQALLAEAERVLRLERSLAASGSGRTDDADRAKNEVDRLSSALRQREAALSILDVRRKAAELSVQEARVAEKEVEARRREAEAALQAAETNVRQTEIRAPFTGVILRKEAELGEMVVPALAGGGTSRGAVVTMADFDSLELEVDVFERDIRMVKSGAPAEILINAYPDLRLKARVRQVVPTADRTKGTVQVKVSFEERDERVLPEMAGKVVFLRERAATPQPPQVLAPASAVVTRSDERGVFLLEAGRARFRPIVAGDAKGPRLVVERGLEGGERVVLDPPAGLQDGDPVRESEESNG